MSVNADDPRTPRVQMADALRMRIKDGRLPAGKRLASVRDLSNEYKVSIATAQAAIDILKTEGLVAAYGNRGTFVQDPTQAQGEDEPSPEYLAITQRLESLDQTVQEMAARLQELENEVRTALRQAQ